MPKNMAKEIKQEVKRGNYASISEFFRDLVSFWNTHRVAGELEDSRQEFKIGKGKVLKTLKDL